LESFIEKLCYRLQATVIPRQWRDITYCLSLLPYSDKGIRKLSENFRCFSDKLHEEDVYNHFQTILSTAKKSTKQEARAVVEEFESKLEESRSKMVEDENLVSKAKTAKNKVQKKGARKQSRRTRTNDSGSDSEEEAFAKNVKENVPPVSRPRRSTTASKKTTEESTSEDEVQENVESSQPDSEEEVFVTKKNTRIAKSARKSSRKK